MRILIAVGQDKIVSGGAVQAVQLAGELRNLGHRVRLVFMPPRDVYASTRFAELEGEGLLPAVVPMRGWRLALGALALRRIIREDGTEVIYAVKGRALTVALLATLGTNMPIVGHRGVNYGFDAAARIRYHHPRVRCIVAVSKSTKELIARSSERLGLKTEVVYQAADDRHFRPTDPGRLRREFGIAPGVPVVAVVGNILPRKGHRHFLESIPGILAEFPSARFVVIGAGDKDPLLGACSPAVAEALTFTGFRTDVHELLPGVTVSVNPAVEGEGLTGTTREALAAGVPVVVTDVAGTKELIDDGVCGLVVPPGDPECLREAVCRLLRDEALRVKLGGAGRARMQEMASSRVRAAAMERIFANAVGGNRSTAG